jgi:hypothetical protein
MKTDISSVRSVSLPIDYVRRLPLADVVHLARPGRLEQVLADLPAARLAWLFERDADEPAAAAPAPKRERKAKPAATDPADPGPVAEAGPAPAGELPSDATLVEFVERCGDEGVAVSQIALAYGAPVDKTSRRLGKLADAGRLERRGKAKGTKYHAAPKLPGMQLDGGAS